MSMTLAQATSIIARRIRGELASPGASDLDIDESTIAVWLNELTSQVIELLRHNPKNYIEFQALIKIDQSLTLDVSAKADLADLGEPFEFPLAVRCGANSVDATIFSDPKTFSIYDGSNWLLQSQINNPLVLFADSQISVKPVSDYAEEDVYVDHTIPHPTIDALNDTLFSTKGDDILIELFMGQYYGFRADGDSDPVLSKLSETHYNNAMVIANGPNIRTSQKL